MITNWPNNQDFWVFLPILRLTLSNSCRRYRSPAVQESGIRIPSSSFPRPTQKWTTWHNITVYYAVNKQPCVHLFLEINSNMAIGSLIVDFPQVARQRQHSSLRSSIISEDGIVAGSGTSDEIVEVEEPRPMIRPKVVKSVSFSPTSKMTLFPCKSKAELKSTWYSEEEKTQFKRLVPLKAAKVTRMLDEAPEHLTEADMCETVGMETYLNPRLCRFVRLQRQRHAQTLVYAQGQCDPALLARVSEQSSLRSREQAHQRALNQLRLGHD